MYVPSNTRIAVSLPPSHINCCDIAVVCWSMMHCLVTWPNPKFDEVKDTFNACRALLRILETVFLSGKSNMIDNNRFDRPRRSLHRGVSASFLPPLHKSPRICLCVFYSCRDFHADHFSPLEYITYHDQSC